MIIPTVVSLRGEKNGEARVRKQRKMQLAQACWVSNHIDPGDFATCDRELGDEESLSRRGHDDPYRAVLIGGVGVLGASQASHFTGFPGRLRDALHPLQFIAHMRDLASGENRGELFANDDCTHTLIKGARMWVSLKDKRSGTPPSSLFHGMLPEKRADPLANESWFNKEMVEAYFLITDHDEM